MSALTTAASLVARASGHTHTTYVTGSGFPGWAIILIVIAVILIIALAVSRPYGRYRSRRYVDDVGPAGPMGPPGTRRTVVEEEDVI